MVYDVGTNNTSFLRMAVILRDLGIKNNKFFLALYDKELIGVDPFSKYLTNEQKIRIMQEICINKWYYLREVVRIPVEGIQEGSGYKLNLGNLTLSYLSGKNINQIVVLPRQHGKTIGKICDDSWAANFGALNTNTIYMNKELKNSIECLRIFKNIRNLLPSWILELEAHKDDKDNEELKIIGYKGNSLKALPSATTIEAAERCGRGLTTSVLYFDEFAFLKYNSTIYTAALPAWKTAAENAKKNGVPYGVTITTTPNSVDTPHGKYCKEMIDSALRWRVEFFDYSDAQLAEVIEKGAQNYFVFVQYSYKELGRSEEWLQKSIREFNGDLLKVKRELLLEWPRSVEGKVFSESQLDLIALALKPSRYPLNIEGYVFNCYSRIDFNRNYLLGVDVSGGLSRDYSAIVLVDPEDFSVVAVFKSNKIDTDNLRKLIITLMTEYFLNSILICESNSYGLNILDNLMKNPMIEPRMLNEERQQLGEKTIEHGVIIKRKRKNISYGVSTNPTSRKLMFELLPEIIDYEYDKIVAQELYDEIAALEMKKNGKIEHSSDGHDDVLMAYLVVRYALMYGSCLKTKFGISSIPSRNNVKTSSTLDAISKIEKFLTKNENTDRNLDSQVYLENMDELTGRQRKIDSFYGEKRNGNFDAFMDLFDD